MLDLHLAIAHHLLAFAIFGIIVAELSLLHAAVTAEDLRRVAIIDMHYGLAAALLIGAGFARAVFAAKGWAFYAGNFFFWAKMGAFLMAGIVSVIPSMTMMHWRSALKLTGALPGAAEIKRVRAYIWAEFALFALIPVFAAAMARGYGLSD